MATLTRATDENLKEKLKQQLEGYFPENSRIAVKFHAGEPRNTNFVQPDFIEKVIGVLKGLGLKPFLFESLAAYSGRRNTIEKHYHVVEEHGFTETSVGCKVIISDDFVVENVDGIDIEVCKDLIDADGMVVISHVKGHPCSGFGAAIKNLGMGGLTKKSKRMLHEMAAPVFCGECNGCGTCKKICPAKCVEITDGKAVFDLERCWGCDQCIILCPQKALKPKVEVFDILLSKGAAAVLRKFAPKKAFYVNVMQKISKFCDCVADGGPMIAKDEGILLGDDPVAIDKASVDLINKQVGHDIFKKTHHKDPYLQIKTAAELGMGSEEYDIS